MDLGVKPHLVGDEHDHTTKTKFHSGGHLSPSLGFKT